MIKPFVKFVKWQNLLYDVHYLINPTLLWNCKKVKIERKYYSFRPAVPAKNCDGTNIIFYLVTTLFFFHLFLFCFWSQAILVVEGLLMTTYEICIEECLAYLNVISVVVKYVCVVGCTIVKKSSCIERDGLSKGNI